MSFCCDFQAARIVKPLDSDTFVTYQITAATPALFFPRDFVYGVKFGKTYRPGQPNWQFWLWIFHSVKI